MKKLLCVEPGKLEYATGIKPELKKGQAIIKIKRIGICGTDLHAFEGTQPYFNYPRILGHELAGELVEFDNAPGFKTGESVTFIPYFNCGECIACRKGKTNCCTKMQVCGVHVDGGMVEYLSVPSSSLLHGDELSFDELALVEPLAIGAHGVRRAAVEQNEFVLVIGAGPIGLGTMEFARIAGAQVIALDINEQRLQFFQQTEQRLKDPDTYATLNYLFIAGLHHFYLQKWLRGSINLSIFLLGMMLLFTGLAVLGVIVLISITVVELKALFKSQQVIQDYNNNVMESVYREITRDQNRCI